MMLSCHSSFMRVLIVDDHELTRSSLRLLLSSQKNIELVVLASNGLEAIELVKRYSPDVVILDLQMPIMNGLNAASQMKCIAPNTRIIAYSSVEDPQVEVMSQTAPIDIFCRKEVSNETLIQLVNQLGQRSLT
jgi:two-component system vancomycin resistance associated response regulator VraR